MKRNKKSKTILMLIFFIISGCSSVRPNIVKNDNNTTVMRQQSCYKLEKYLICSDANGNIIKKLTCKNCVESKVITCCEDNDNVKVYPYLKGIIELLK